MSNREFKVLDSDIHIIEPPDLWQRYIDPAFRDRAPVRYRGGHNHALNQERWQPYAERGWTSKVQLEAMDIQLPISEENKRKILWDNCAAYYGLPA